MAQTRQFSNEQRITATEALRRLRERKANPSDIAAVHAVRQESAPHPDLREAVAADLQDLVLSVLKLPLSEFSPTTPLLEYGLDSIAATEIGTLFTARFGITLPPTTFFEFPDVRSFSQYLVENHSEELKARYGGLSQEEKAVGQTASVEQPVAPVIVEQKRAVPAVAFRPAEKAPVEALFPPVAPAGKDGLSIEELWKIGGASEATRAEVPFKQPSRTELQAMMLVANQARVMTIHRKGKRDLECATYGEGPPVLMLGGLLMLYSAMWRPQLEALGEKYRLIMFHMAGCGGVELYDGLSLSSLVTDVNDLLDALDLKEPLPVVGCSFGGVLSQAFCLAHPERCSALVVGVSTPVAEGATDFQCLMRELQRSSSFMEVNRGWPMASLPAYSAVIEGFDLREQLSTLRIPALVIAGGKDEYTPPGHSRMIAERLPSATLIEVPDAGHLLPFTHHELFNEHVLKFLDSVSAARTPQEKPVASTPDRSSYLPTSRSSLSLAEGYVTKGEQGHCVILPAVAAQAAFLLNRACNEGKSNPVDYRSYFVTSMEEAFDAAVRLVRHQARNKRPSSSGTVLVVDSGRRWIDYLDPLRRGPEEALIPEVRVVPSVEKAAEIMDGESEVVAVVFVANADARADSADQLFERATEAGASSILVELEEKDRTPKSGFVGNVKHQPDAVVFGECLTGFQAPLGACSIKSTISNPWLMTPNEGYVRQPMAAMGYPLTLAVAHLSDSFATSGELRAELRRIADGPGATYEAHVRYGNVGYARVARMHGYDGHFFDAHGMTSKLRLGNGSSREIVDCLLNVGTCPRGLNPLDIVDNVVRTHNPEYDYWKDLSRVLEEKTGYTVVLPVSSQTGALESGITLGLMAAAGRKKMLCFSGGAGFSMLSAASAFDPLFDLFRKPFRPIYPHVVFIDPTANDAEEKLRTELESGEIALVWLETIQVEGNAVRPLPDHLIRAVNELRYEGGYLIAVDETQTNLWTGRFLHSEGVIESPDIVAIGTALCDSLLPAGAVLTTKAVFERASRHNARRAEELLSRSRCQLSAHVALNSLRAIFDNDLMTSAREIGRYFQDSLRALTKEFPLVREIRGAGLLLAIEFDLSGHSTFVQRSFGYLLWGAMLRDPQGGVAAVVCPIHNTSLRLVPALSISRAEVDAIVANIRRRLRAGVEGVVRDCAAYNSSLGEARTAAFLLDQINSSKGSVIPMENGPIDVADRKTIKPLKARSGLPTVCIIGAGVGGIAMAGALKKKGIPFDCFDKRERIGGIWAFDEKRENTSVWYSLNMNTPSGRYQFSDYPMPANYPDFPQWHQVRSYLEGYIDHLDMRSNFQLGQTVESARRLDGGRWRIKLASGETRYYDAVIVANGHHNTPNYPAYAEKIKFNGPAIHSQHYRYRHEYRDKNVMIVGIGNSGAQIAVDVSQDAKITYISQRRGVYLLPHYLFGVRVDKILGPSLSWWFKKLLPGKLYPVFFTGVYHLVGNHRKIGMPKPDHLMMTCLPTVTESLANRIGDGKIKLVPEVEKVDGNTVHLADGSAIEVDAIIYSTGYHTTLPFFEKDFFEVKDNKVHLYKRIFMPGVPDLAFVGMFQAIRWGFLDIMESQANLISEYFAGSYQLPSVAEQRDDIDDERRNVEKEFMHTLRNNYYLHGDTYVRELRNETKRGKRRARATGYGQPTAYGGDVVSIREDKGERILSAAE